jgi:hypothetical protein
VVLFIVFGVTLPLTLVGVLQEVVLLVAAGDVEAIAVAVTVVARTAVNVGRDANVMPRVERSALRTYLIRSHECWHGYT